MFVLEWRGMGKTFGLVSYDTHQHHFEKRAVFAGCGMRAAMGKREFGVVGGKMEIELLAGAMRRGRGRITAVEDDMRQTYTVKHIWKGLTLLN